MTFTQNYNKLKEEYYTISKKILNYETRRDLNDNERIKQYTNEIITVYNNFVKFASENLLRQNELIRNKVNTKFERFYERNFLRCLHTLNLDTVLPGKYIGINLESLVTYEQEASSQDLDLQIGIDNGDSPLNSEDENEKSAENDPKIAVENLRGGKTLEIEQLSTTGLLANTIQTINNIQTGDNMVLTKVEYHNMCTRTLNTAYSGDPLGLNHLSKQSKHWRNWTRIMHLFQH